MADRLEDKVGLNPIREPRDGDSVDVVFVHGLGGGSHTTWAHEGAAESFWPRWIGDEFPEVRVWTLGYVTSVSAWKERSLPLPDLGIQVLEELSTEGIGARPVVFITHSMGGLVVKQILDQAQSQGVARYRKIVGRTLGVAFFSTPHSGSNLASFAEFARAILKTSEQVKDLQQHSAQLRDLHGTFLTFVNERRPICRSYAERRPVQPGFKFLDFEFKIPKEILVVDATSAEPNIPGERAIPLEEDHISIAKPRTRKAKAYRYARSFLRECLDSIDRPPEDRAPPQKFLVAFSLAGEQRDLVRPVAEAVQQELGASKVFYEEWFEHYIEGPEAGRKLQQIYGSGSALVVVCVSGRHGDKPWTRAEHAAIAARYKEAEKMSDQLGLLPVRVGDGDVEGVPFAAVPDIRGKPASEAAGLILKRLRLIIPELERGDRDEASWPDTASSILWPVADHTEARDAFEHLMRRNARFRYLPVEGPTQVGKTHITKQMRDYGLGVGGLACGRFDFKGTASLDNEVSSFVSNLGVPEPSGGDEVTSRLHQVLDALRKQARPTLLVFDTYEQVGEARNWVENTLLPSLIRAEWLRVVIAGQPPDVPKPTTAMLRAISSALIALRPPSPHEWFEYGRQYDPGLSLDFVVQVHDKCQGQASTLDAVLGPRG